MSPRDDLAGRSPRADRAAAKPATPPAPAPGNGAAAKRSYGRMLVGWLLLPLLAAAGVVAAGVHQAAHHPDAWYTRAVQMLIDLG